MHSNTITTHAITKPNTREISPISTKQYSIIIPNQNREMRGSVWNLPANSYQRSYSFRGCDNCAFECSNSDGSICNECCIGGGDSKGEGVSGGEGGLSDGANPRDGKLSYSYYERCGYTSNLRTEQPIQQSINCF